MAKFEVPSVFTAIDKFSAKVNKMASVSDKFGVRTQAAATRANRSFNKLFPSIGAGAKQFAQFATAGLLFTGVMSGISSSVQVISDFEQANADLAAVTGKTVAQNRLLAEDAKRLGSITSKTATEVVGLQESLARLGFQEGDIINMTEGILNGAVAMNAELDRTADLAGAVVKTFDDISSADTAVTMDQMTLATQRSALNFEKLETALPIVGGAANAAGISFEKTVALLGKLSDAGIDASSSSTALRNIFLDSAKKGLSYEQILDNIVANQDKLTTANDEFGKRGAVSAVILAKNIKGTAKLTQELEKLNNAETAGSVARDAANKRLDTLQGTVTLLGSAYEGFILSLDEGNGIFGNTAKNVIRVITEMFNLASGVESTGEKLTEQQERIRSFASTALFLVKTLGILFASMIAIKTALVVWRAATIAMNVVIGIHTALTKTNAFALRGNMVAMNAYRIATVVTAAAQWVAAGAMTGFSAAMGVASTAMGILNAVMALNPIIFIITGIIALIAAIVYLVANWDELVAAFKKTEAFDAILGVFNKIKNAWNGITSAFTEGGFLAGIKQIGLTILDFILTPIESIIKLIGKIPGMEGISAGALDSINDFRGFTGAEEISSEDPVLNSATATEEQRIIRETNTNSNSVLQINAPDGAVNQEESNLSNDIQLSSTMTA
ncbi:MAG: hypothetical protein S4CHLAM20_04180 [Chlamydiia bacterium]|nr:hypothetical protein [Chlamydiia bacterium]